MSSIIMRVIVCDICDEYLAESVAHSARLARAVVVRDFGWKRTSKWNGNRFAPIDVCPDCLTPPTEEGT